MTGGGDKSESGYNEKVLAQISKMREKLSSPDIKLDLNDTQKNVLSSRMSALEDQMKVSFEDKTGQQFKESALEWRKDIGFQNNQYIEISNVVIKDVDFSKMTTSDGMPIDFDQYKLNGVKFEHCRFGKGSFAHSQLSDVTFNDCSFKKTEIRGGSLKNVSMKHCKFSGFMIKDNFAMENVKIAGVFYDDPSLTQKNVNGIQGNSNVHDVKVIVEPIKNLKSDITAPLASTVTDIESGPTLHITYNTGNLIKVVQPDREFTPSDKLKFADLSAQLADKNTVNDNHIVPDQKLVDAQIDYKMYTKKQDKKYWKEEYKNRAAAWKEADDAPGGCSQNLRSAFDIRGFDPPPSKSR